MVCFNDSLITTKNSDFFLSIKVKRRKLTDGIIQLSDKSEDECEEMDRSTLDTENGEINHIRREIPDYMTFNMTLFNSNVLKFKNS